MESSEKKAWCHYCRRTVNADQTTLRRNIRNGTCRAICFGCRNFRKAGGYATNPHYRRNEPTAQEKP